MIENEIQFQTMNRTHRRARPVVVVVVVVVRQRGEAFITL